MRSTHTAMSYRNNPQGAVPTSHHSYGGINEKFASLHKPFNIGGGVAHRSPNAHDTNPTGTLDTSMHRRPPTGDLTLTR